MFLVLEISFIILMAAILAMLVSHERKFRKEHLSRATVQEYWNGKERRRYVRFKKTLEVTYTLRKNSQVRSAGKVVDVSEGGMKLLLDEKLTNDTLLDLHLNLPDSRGPIRVTGKIVWLEECAQQDKTHHPNSDASSCKRFFYAGLQFLPIIEPAGRDLIRYIRSLATDTQAIRV